MTSRRSVVNFLFGDPPFLKTNVQQLTCLLEVFDLDHDQVFDERFS